MDSLEEKVGYLTRAVEENKADVKHLTTQMDELTTLVAQKFNTVESVFKVVKFLVLAAGAILTLKLGDIGSLWHQLFK